MSNAISASAPEVRPTTADDILIHHAADLFPLMDETRFKKLVEDIQRNGLVHPIILYDGKILDGRNRYRACKAANIEPRFDHYIGNPFEYAWSANGQRRDLVQDQRYLIWKRCGQGAANWKAEHEKAAERANEARSDAAEKRQRTDSGTFIASPATSCGDIGRDYKAEQAKKTSSAVAKEAGVNRGSVERMDRLDRERPDLADKVAHGELKPTEAMRQMKKDEVVKKIAALPEGKYRVIYADPPWDYNNEFDVAGYTTVAATDHYPVMPLSEICALDVKSLAAPDSVLLLWATSPLLAQAFEVVKAWGFTYKTHFVWYKGRGAFGHYHKANCELLLIATRGLCVPDADERADQMQNFARGRHSQKPKEWRELIDRLWPNGPRIELFQRTNAVPSHWHVWGAESVEMLHAATMKEAA
jgi:N6-adenosine-specific RNA methylase IME4